MASLLRRIRYGSDTDPYADPYTDPRRGRPLSKASHPATLLSYELLPTGILKSGLGVTLLRRRRRNPEPVHTDPYKPGRSRLLTKSGLFGRLLSVDILIPLPLIRVDLGRVHPWRERESDTVPYTDPYTDRMRG